MRHPQPFVAKAAKHVNAHADALQVLLLNLGQDADAASEALLVALRYHGIDESSLRDTGGEEATGWVVDVQRDTVFLDLWAVDRHGWTGREPIAGWGLTADEACAVAWWLLCSWQPDAMQSAPSQADIEHAVRWVDGGGRVPREWVAQAERVQAIDECFGDVAEVA